MIYKTLAEWMNAKRLKDADVASKVQLSRSQISRIRRGVSTPKPEAAKSLEALTKIPASRFVMGEAGAAE